jgi:hypothetical protein
VLLYRRLGSLYATASIEDFCVFACFFASCIGCLTTSGTYHLISNHSHAVAVWGNRADYLGIVFLIWGSFVPCIYYGFQERLDLIRIYWSKVRFFLLSCSNPKLSPTSQLTISNIPDLPHRIGNRICEYRTVIPYSRMAGLSCRSFCCHGSLRNHTTTPCTAHIWRCPRRSPYKSPVGCCPGSFVHYWRRALCLPHPGANVARDI